MKEEQLQELFKATNTAEPLSEGWPGLLRYGTAVAAAEREECAKACEKKANEWFAHLRDGAIDCAEVIRMRSNAKLTGAEPALSAERPR